jgi:hypothetical protein
VLTIEIEHFDGVGAAIPFIKLARPMLTMPKKGHGIANRIL